jgi:phosphoribosylamine-glycine ligase
VKFLFRAWNGECLPIALRVQSEGNDVQIYIEEASCKTVGDGLIVKAPDLGRAVQWADVVVYESNFKTLSDEAEKVRAVRPTIGSSALAGRLEDDRGFAEEFAKRGGLVTPDGWKQFDGPNAWQSARRFLESQDEKSTWVWKPNGDSPASTYVANDLDELTRMLVYWRTLYIKHNTPPDFILTPKIDSLVEISTEGWWDGRSFSHFNHTLERNRLMPGDIGEKTGCAGNVVWLTPENKLVQSLLIPLQKNLGSAYRGPIDINAMIRKEDNQAVFLEFTPRFGYDAIHGFMELVDDMGKLLSDIATGKSVGIEINGQSPERFAAAYRITIPPYPEEPSKKDETKAVGVPIFGVNTTKYDSHVHLIETRLSRSDELETSGPSGYVVVVSATGDSPETAMRAAYKKGESICIPQMRWRNDLDTAIQKVYDDLIETGWASGLGESSKPIRIFGRQIRKSY